MSGVALIIGAEGFVGRRACAAAKAAGYQVVGAGIGSSGRSGPWRFVQVDVRDRDGIGALVQETRPELVLHLAAISHVPAATANPGLAYEVNVIGAVHLLDALIEMRMRYAADPAVVIVGSGEQYGSHEHRRPLRESAETNPVTHYAVTKMAQEVVALRAFRASGLRVMCTRSFNHSGAGHAPNFLVPSLARKAAALPKRGGTLLTGNQTIVRDFLHVDDVVDAYFQIARRGSPGQVYNVCSGVGISVREIAEGVLAAFGVEANIETDPSAVRAIDVPWLVGDPSRLRTNTDWRPRRTVQEMILDVMGEVMQERST